MKESEPDQDNRAIGITAWSGEEDASKQVAFKGHSVFSRDQSRRNHRGKDRDLTRDNTGPAALIGDGSCLGADGNHAGIARRCKKHKSSDCRLLIASIWHRAEANAKTAVVIVEREAIETRSHNQKA